MTRLWWMMVLPWVLALGCKQPNDTKWQFAPDMADSPAGKAQSAYLNPPDHSVDISAHLYADNEIDAEELFENPLLRASSHQKNLFRRQGEQLYLTFCQHCHGVGAQGNGTIVDVYPRPPDLTDEAYQQRKDGFFFHKITFGGGIMPALGHAVSDIERFKIIMHLRKLQEQKKAQAQQKSSASEVKEKAEGSP